MSEAFTRAFALVGAPVKPLGRNPEFGLDCVGLALCAYELKHLPVPPYRQHDGCWDVITASLSSNFREVRAEDVQAGDLAVLKLPKSFHFAVLGSTSLIHADQRVGRIVERPRRRLPEHGRFFRYTGVVS